MSTDTRTPNERSCFDAIQKNDATLLERLLSTGEARAECYDDQGCTPLQQAAFRGNTELCRMLLSYGANVNSNQHQHGYTALMFGALSGKLDVVEILLKAGADIEAKNRLDKSASEMAGFTGQYHIVNFIQHYLPLSVVEQWTSGPKARLNSNLAQPLHEWLCTDTPHPVRSAIYLRDHIELLHNPKDLLYVVEEICESQMKQRETNEVQAFKIHLIRVQLKECVESLKYQFDASKLEKYAKSLLIPLPGRQCCTQSDLILRDGIRSFPWLSQSVLVNQLVRQLSRDQNAPAWPAVQVALIGQRTFIMQSNCGPCGTCGIPVAGKRCGSCRAINYCTTECQKFHWPIHKRQCAQKKQELENICAQKQDKNEQGIPDSDLTSGIFEENNSVADVQFDKVVHQTAELSL